MSRNSVPILFWGPLGCRWHQMLVEVTECLSCFSLTLVKQATDLSLSKRESGPSPSSLILVHEAFCGEFRQSMVPRSDLSLVLYLRQEARSCLLRSEKQQEVWLAEPKTPADLEHILLRHWTEFHLQQQDESAQRIEGLMSVLTRTIHDLKNPLTAILFLSQYELSPPEEWPNRAERIALHANAMNDLINRHLAQFKDKNQSLDIQFSEVNLIALIEQQLEPEIQAAEKCGLTFKLRVARSVPERLFVDRTLLIQILRNLIDNAIKFTEHGSIELRLAYDPHHHMLSADIKDTGLGIEKNVHEKIFCDFVQTKKDLSDEPFAGSVGLGLGNARRMAQALGGGVELLESAPGSGTTFRLKVNARTGSSQALAGL